MQISASSCPSLTCLLQTCFHKPESNAWHTHLSASGKPCIQAPVGSSGHPSTMISEPCISEERGGGSLTLHCVPCPRGKALSADVRHAGLVSAMFLRGSEQVACPDPEAGLWVSNRAGSFQKVLIPPDALAFQLGEASQVC